MSLDHFQFSSILAECKPELEGSEFIGFLARDPATFILQCKKGKKQIYFLLCLRDPFMRIHLLSKLPETLPADFSRHVSKTLAGYSLESIDQLNDDRIISMIFVKGVKKRILIAEFFSKRFNMYMLDESNKIEYSLRQTETSIYQLPPKHQPFQPSTTSIQITSAQIEKEYELREKSALFEKQKQELLRHLKEKLNKTQKKLAQDALKLNESKEWPQVYHEGVLLQSNMYQYKKGMSSLTVEDWDHGGNKVTFQLDSAIPFVKEVENRFRKSKKMKAAISHLERQLEMGKVLENDLLSSIAMVEAVSDYSELIAASKTLKYPLQKKEAPKKVKKKEKALPYHEFVSESGLRIWVGKKAADNEILTFRLANGSDWWFHAHGYPGSHVILKVKKGIDPDKESIADAMQLAFEFSKAKQQNEVEVLCTQCKFVSRFGKGHTGKVQVSKHKLVYIKSDPNRIARLKERAHK